MGASTSSFASSWVSVHGLVIYKELHDELVDENIRQMDDAQG